MIARIVTNSRDRGLRVDCLQGFTSIKLPKCLLIVQQILARHAGKKRKFKRREAINDVLVGADTERKRERERERERGRGREREREILTDRQTARQTGRQTQRGTNGTLQSKAETD